MKRIKRKRPISARRWKKILGSRGYREMMKLSKKRDGYYMSKKRSRRKKRK